MSSLYADIIKHLKAHGCTFVRSGKGSHEVWFSPLSGRTFSVSRSLTSVPLANAILKQAGLPKAF